MFLRLGLLLLIFPLAVLMGFYFSELSDVNDCLRVQGSFDYVRSLCDHSQKHGFIPYFQRHPFEVNSALIASTLGLFLCVFGLYKGKR
ncbi:MAG: hypothetical protein OQK12_08775 [Motiliproteus sp.]|nr:hypothetical protein [Motiliproteus sp.]MCW9052285.1 hypothetical protein [Motiliproteus sp.]